MSIPAEDIRLTAATLTILPLRQHPHNPPLTITLNQTKPASCLLSVHIACYCFWIHDKLMWSDVLMWIHVHIPVYQHTMTQTSIQLWFLLNLWSCVDVECSSTATQITQLLDWNQRRCWSAVLQKANSMLPDWWHYKITAGLKPTDWKAD